jgi:hypothetical protein
VVGRGADRVRGDSKNESLRANRPRVYRYGTIEKRNIMITRRMLIFTSAPGLLALTARPALSAPPAGSDPLAIANAIYARVAKGKGDTGGGFVIDSKAAKAKYLSKALIALWAKADAHTQKGDIGPMEFDPVTNSQDPDVKSFTAVAEQQEADKAVIAVSIAGHRTPRAKAVDDTIRYHFVLDGGQWKIDDITGAIDAEPWSVRALLTDFLKY